MTCTRLLLSVKLTGIIRRSKRKPIVIGYGIVFNGLEEVQGNNLDLSFYQKSEIILFVFINIFHFSMRQVRDRV